MTKGYTVVSLNVKTCDTELIRQIIKDGVIMESGKLVSVSKFLESLIIDFCDYRRKDE